MRPVSLIMLCLAAALGGAGLKPETLKLLAECQDATYSLDFDHAEALAHEAMLESALHPLPHIFLQAAILGRIQEFIDAGADSPELFERFQKESDSALSLARGMELRDPDAQSQLYLGLALGSSGLARMLNGQYLKAYHEGKAAAASLETARLRDPGLTDALLGLGQYGYYCGRMGGLLRFAANLHGDIPGGIAMLEACAAEQGPAAIAARVNLARIYSLELPDFSKALPYVLELRARYPRNHAFIHDAMALARGDAYASSEGQALLEAVLAQWDLGWRPPAYARLDIEHGRLLLARAYHKEGRDDLAAPHFKSLAASKDKAMANAGRKGLAAAPAMAPAP